MTHLRRFVVAAALAVAALQSAPAQSPSAPGPAVVTLNAGALRLSFDARGTLTELRDTTRAAGLLAVDTISSLLTVVSDGRRHSPTSLAARRTRDGSELTLRYADIGARLSVRARARATHLTLDITSATPAGRIDAIIWGPYATSIARTVGEVIGVVRDDAGALGLQVLNAKTLGGAYPNREGSTWARGIAATARPWGSSLQAYSINRSKPRTVDAWGGNHRDMPVAPIAGETVVGSAIALFVASEPRVLDVLERIELDEGLPHPTFDGVWWKRSPLFGRSYLISSFGEDEVDEMLAHTSRAGFISLYHEGPFKSWGHFILDSAQFPRGRTGLKEAVGKAHAMGLRLGVHTLTNFINTNDPYVTPIPDARLSVTGTSTLVAAVDAAQRTLEVRAPTFFNDTANNSLHTVRIGTELIQYRAVSTTAPFQLLDCQRGAFGTRAAAHAAGDTVGKLFDHPYNVFFPNFAMQREVARNLADFLNETGVDHIDFDGHEGALASGQGDYALEVFTNDVRSQVTHDMIFGTSVSKTFYWHTGSYYNWGEPWNGGFTESMQQYRIDNQALFDRNYMPHMLGWYLLTERTTLAEMEWMLARAAGFDAGFAMVARPKALRANPLTPQLLDAIREWEAARAAGAFTNAQRARLRDAHNEFHLAPTGASVWTLTPVVESPPFTHSPVERQPGEPTQSTFTFQQPWSAQPLQFRLAATGGAGTVDRVVVRIDGFLTIELPVSLASGERLASDSTGGVQLYDTSGKPKARIALAAPLPVLAPGRHTVSLDARFGGTSPPTLTLQLRGNGDAEDVRAAR
ncbi:MAG: hypothetical protein IT359_02130 [Gemmatimonadaceae bacterium]|nr:hypothetical protein [Gemmatimonadaceae bacterium]